MIQQYLHKKQIRASNRLCWNTRICFILPWCNPKRCTSGWNGSAAGKVPDAWEGKSASSRVGIFRKRPYSFGILRGECRLLVPKIQDPYRLGAGGCSRRRWNHSVAAGETAGTGQSPQFTESHPFKRSRISGGCVSVFVGLKIANPDERHTTQPPLSRRPPAVLRIPPHPDLPAGQWSWKNQSHTAGRNPAKSQ